MFTTNTKAAYEVSRLKNIQKGKIIYGGMKRGRRNFLIINLIVTAVFIAYLTYALPYVTGKLHGPYEFDYDKFLSSTEDIVIDEEIEMKKREDKSVQYTAFSDESYLDGNKYRFNVKFDDLQKTDIHYTAEYENKETGKTETVILHTLCFGIIDGRKIPVIFNGEELPGDEAELSGIFTTPGKVIVSDISKLTADGSEIVMNEYMFDARGVEMNSESSDVTLTFLMLALLIFLYGRLIKHYINPYKHPAYKQLYKYGELDEVVDNIEEQFASDNIIYEREQKEFISRDWIMKKELFKNRIVKSHYKGGRYS